MPNNALAIFESGQLPAHIAAMNDEVANIVPRMTVNSVTFEGKVWSINMDGKKTKLMRTNAEGEEEPVAIVSLVVLDYNKERGREFYKGKYDPTKPLIPTCWSEDSKVPHDNVPEKQAPTCASCPNSKKGSAQTDQGKGTTACSQFQKLAVVPVAGLMEHKFPPMRLKIKITSIYDASGAEKHPNWFAWSQYIDLLTSKGVRSTGLLPTKVKFDPLVAYPKLLFSPGKDWLPDDALAVVKEMMLSDPVKELLASTYDPSQSATGTKPLPADEDEEELAPGEMPVQAKPGKPTIVQAVGKGTAVKPKATPAPVEAEADEGEGEGEVQTTTTEDEDEGEVQTAEQIAAEKRAVQAKANAATAKANVAKAAGKAAATKAAAVQADDGEEEEVAVTPVKPAKAAAAAAPAKGAAKGATPAKGALNAPPEVAEMLDGWDD